MSLKTSIAWVSRIFFLKISQLQEKWILIDVHKIDLYLSPVSETATIRKLNVSAFDRRKSRLKRIIINSFRGHFMKIDSRLDFENLDSFLRDHPIYVLTYIFHLHYQYNRGWARNKRSGNMLRFENPSANEHKSLEIHLPILG